jgi:transposase InsO family protein
LLFIGGKNKRQFIIPYEFEIKDIIFLNHESDSIHIPAREIYARLLEVGISWIGALHRINKELKDCSCKNLIALRSPAKKIRYYRKIECHAPKERFQMDIAELPPQIQIKKKRYILNIKDHFSKYVWSFSIKNKSSNTVAKCFKMLLSEGHIPKMVHTDNGTEFQGSFKKLLAKYEIKHVKGRPRNPQCQGSIENFNGYLKKYLLLNYFIKTCSEFNCKTEQIKIADAYNRKVNCVTKYKPWAVYYSTSKKLWAEVYMNTCAYYSQKIEKNSYLLLPNQKVGIAARI